MPKYQLVFDSTKILADDEFDEIIRPFIEAHPEFTFKFAINLEGIKKEFWEKKEEIIDGILHAQEPTIVIENAFDDMSNLFKLG